ncbi:MAG: hypothetical protein GY757_28030 [bacterium]|nr:hypothetical protein [bacterium]
MRGIMESKATIDGIKDKYRFKCSEIRRIPEEFIGRWGYPSKMERIPGGFLILFGDVEATITSLVLFMEGFTKYEVIAQSPYLFSFCYYQPSNEVYFSESWRFRSKPKPTRSNSQMMKANENCLSCVRLDSGPYERRIVYSESEKHFFPREVICDEKGTIFCFDSSAKEVKVFDSSGKPGKRIDVGEHFIGAMRLHGIKKSGEEHAVYFGTNPDQARKTGYQVATDEVSSIYCVDEQGDASVIKKLYEAISGKTGKNATIYDFAFRGGEILIFTDSYVVKLDAQLKEIFNTRIYDSSEAIWEPYILSLTEDVERENVFFGLSYLKKQLQFSIYQIEI